MRANELNRVHVIEVTQGGVHHQGDEGENTEALVPEQMRKYFHVLGGRE
jgi:hypothetical protein